VSGSRPAGHFDALYAAADDPWAMRTRWYERRKYAVTVASLPCERYRHGLEIGCSVGELTAALAGKCDRVSAWDISAAAVRRARERTRGLAGVQVEQRAVPGDPLPPVDLLVLSEVLYFLSADDLDAVIVAAQAALLPGGTLVAVHWRHPAGDPLTGDGVHARLRSALPWPRVAAHEEPDFLLDCWTASDDPRAASVAAGEFLV
jgi:SAM-dependent methyltransferase